MPGNGCSVDGDELVCEGGVPPAKVPVEIMEPDGEALRPCEDGVLLSNWRVVVGITGEGGEDMPGEDGVRTGDNGVEPGSAGVL